MDNQLKKQHQNNIAFVLGNGRSRLNADLNVLQTYGTIYGCNALYREFEPDHLIAVDVKMINEIIASGYHRTHSVWTNPNKGVSTKNNINFFSPHKGWSSGPTALWLAAQQGYKKIYILGFDYQGLLGKFNNVYADTFNYKKSADAATFHGNWLSQTDKVVKEYRSIKFYRVVEDTNAFIPDTLSTNHSNLQHISYSEFLSTFRSNDIYIDKINQKTTI
jgi:hypothetical protein